MKKISTLACILLASATAHAQITITAADVPIPGIDTIMEYTSASNLPGGNSQNWNTASNAQLGPTTLNFMPETVPFWLGLGANVYRANSKYLTSSLTYNIFFELAKTTNGFHEIGFNVPEQAYSISSFTGNATDSLKIADQDIVYTSPKTWIPFPFTTASTQNNTGRRVMAFTINAPSLGLNNTPFTHVLNEVRKDSIIGWGQMRVYTPDGPSKPYDVLMNQITQYSLDSFYMAGSPAPATLLTAFGVTQGQKVNANNAIQFHRKGNYNYLYRIFYGADNTFSTIQGAFSHLDNLERPLGINQMDQEYATLIFPNPANNTDVNLQIMGSEHIDVSTFTITNMMGHLVVENKANLENNSLKLPTANLAKGQYIVNVRAANGNTIITEKVTIL